MREVALSASPAALAAWALAEHGEVAWLDDRSPKPGWSFLGWSPSEVATGRRAAWAALAEAAARPSPVAASSFA
ncbi:hypothetical protein IIA16_04230, partial [bacterium]|nr:hypothetical protein [bacterium]